VETLDQVAFLQSEGCLEGQGYYFSKPVTARQFAWAIEGGVLHFTPKSERMLPRA
jgi:EAL domain-containing protein (putative c-di-GMP-specific phosphodiesterase class I)